MGFFKNLRENARMAKYLRMYDYFLPPAVRPFYEEKEFVAEISKVWGLQAIHEGSEGIPGYPFSMVRKIPGLAERIEWAKSEGATDKDIAWWWNLSPINRILIKGADKAYRQIAFFDSVNKGLEIKKIMQKIGQFFTSYAEDKPDISSMTLGDKEFFLGEDRPLPIELHDRVDIYLKNHSDPNNLSKMKQEMVSFSSANACVRYLIKTGRL